MLLREEKMEIQSPKIEEIVKKSAERLTVKYDREILVEDAGFFVEALKGFPGPYASYVYDKIGPEGILRLLEGVSNRAAEFRSAVAFCKPNYIEIFTGKVRGKIALETKGVNGFGFDPIFIPENESKTFGEMSLEDKTSYSHRARALRKFCKWYVKKF